MVTPGCAKEMWTVWSRGFFWLGFDKEAKEEREIDSVVQHRPAIVDPPQRGSPRILTARRVHGNALRSLTAPIFMELLP